MYIYNVYTYIIFIIYIYICVYIYKYIYWVTFRCQKHHNTFDF